MNVKPGFKQTEVGVIPKEWNVVSLERVCDPKRTICYGIVQVGSYTNGGISVLAIKNLNTDYVSDVHRCSPEIEKPYARSRVRPGDVLISVKGTVGRIGLVPNHYHGNISRDLARIGLTESDVPEYWFHMLQSEIARRRLVLATVGTTRLELSIGTLKQVTMPRAPKQQQTAIAGALGDVHALVGALEKLIAKKRDLKQAAMQQLLTGQIRLPGFSGEWEVKRLDELVSICSGGTPSTSQAQFWDGDVLWCTPTDITALNGFKYLNSTSRTLSQQGLKASSAELIPANSIVMTSRATIGVCAINQVPVTTNQGFKNFVPSNSVDVEFLYYFLQTMTFMALCSSPDWVRWHSSTNTKRFPFAENPGGNAFFSSSM